MEHRVSDGISDQIVLSPTIYIKTFSYLLDNMPLKMPWQFISNLYNPSKFYF